MSEGPDKESKTEEASEKKIRDTLEKGNVPVSRETTTFAALAALLMAFTFLLAAPTSRLRVVLQGLIGDLGGWPLENAADVSALSGMLALETLRFAGPIVLALLTAGLAAAFLQNAPRLVSSRIKPQLSRLSLAKGWTRVFGAQGRAEFAKAVLKLSALVAGAVILVGSAKHHVYNAMLMAPDSLPGLMLSLAKKLLGIVTGAAALLMIGDLLWSRFSWRRDLRMTRQEVKDETKQSEGDPIVKSRMRSLARDRARRRMMAAVPRATLVIINPTHYAIAMRYVRSEGGAPVVIAKGADLIALRIREIAHANSIPVVEDKALARALYDSVQVDRFIPPEFYRAVAEIVFHLMAAGGRQR